MNYIKLISKKIFEKIIYFKINKFYFLLSFKKIYLAPSLRQIKIIKKHIKSNWKLFEYEIIKNLINVVKKQHRNIVFLDIGANIGYNSIAYSKILRKFDGRCISFEPVLLNAQYFIKNTNNLNNLSLFSIGLSNKQEVLQIGMPEYVKKKKKDFQNTGFLSSKLKIDPSSKIFHSLAVPLDRISEQILKPKEVVEFVKIDSEGYELNILRGAKKLLLKHLPILQIEVNPNVLNKKEIIKVFSFLYNLNYLSFCKTKFTFINNNEIFFVHNKKNKQLNLIKTYLNSFKI